MSSDEEWSGNGHVSATCSDRGIKTEDEENGYQSRTEGKGGSNPRVLHHRSFVEEPSDNTGKTSDIDHGASSEPECERSPSACSVEQHDPGSNHVYVDVQLEPKNVDSTTDTGGSSTTDTGGSIPRANDSNIPNVSTSNFINQATGRNSRNRNYGTLSSPVPEAADTVSQSSALSDIHADGEDEQNWRIHGNDYPETSSMVSMVSGDDDLPYGYMPGMNVEITESDNRLPTQRLPEGLRHVMLHVVGSRPSEEVKFRRLKYRMESDPSAGQDSFLPRGPKSQRPPVIRQSSRRLQLARQRSRELQRHLSQDHLTDISVASSSYHQSLVRSEAGDLPDELHQQAVAEVTKPSGLFRGSTGRQRGILIVLAVNDLMASMSLSILAPFFPKVARQKGISDATSGWVFGVFALVQCVTSPVFGKFLPRLGAKFLSQSGQFFAGGCTILFGMLQFIDTSDNNVLFLVYCFTLRMFMAVGCSANATSAFAIAARTFPDNPATVFGLLETAVGVGLMMGPAIGGVLYEVGGFVAPFAFIGGAMVLSVPMGMCVLPSDRDEESVGSGVTSSIRDFLKIPAITITSMAAFVACLAWVMPDPTLEPHLSKFNLSPTIIGLVFLLMSACYAVCSPVWGWVADNVPDSSPMMVIGFAGTGLGFAILGPSPIFQLPPDFAPLWLDIVGLILVGFMVSLALVPTYDKILDAAEKAGIDDSLANCSIVAGIWNASYSFGEFVGPVLAGWMMGKVGFAWTMSVASGLCFLMSFVMLVLYLYERKFGPTGVQTTDNPTSRPIPSDNSTRSANERTPLLGAVRT